MDGGSAGYVLFRVADEMFGLPIERVQSIIRYERGTPVPRAPEVVEGVINLRGRIVPVVDLVKRLGRGEFEPGPTARIVVAEGAAGLVGLAVDAASEVVRIDPASVQPAPAAALSAETADAFEGVTEYEGTLVILLDLDQAVPRAEYASAVEAAAIEEGGTRG
ncbi:MAG: chemotaxis protein CheW [Actinobacteria bacterium]|nr:MAG: chemotaxis protein CheW [Actinomycetota bacterium]